MQQAEGSVSDPTKYIYSWSGSLAESIYPSVPKKKFHLLHKWRTSDAPYRKLYGMCAFSQVKIQMKIFRSPTGLHLFLILIFRMACHVPVTRPKWNHLGKMQIFPWVFTYEITGKWPVPSEIPCENQNFSMIFHLWIHLHNWTHGKVLTFTSEITCENQNFSMSFHLWIHLQVTLPKWNHLWKSKLFHEFNYENIEFKMHTYLISFQLILIIRYYLNFHQFDCYYFCFFVWLVYFLHSS